MGTTNPRILINALGDLKEECERWLTAVRETLISVADIQRKTVEKVQQTKHRANILQTEAIIDQERVGDVRREVENLRAKCENGKKQASETLKESTNALKKSKATLADWQTRLQMALAWLERAQERLRIALIELDKAEYEMQSAKSDLSYAKSRLRDCLDSESRRDCSSERDAVQKAQMRVSQAERRLRVAILEVQAAEEEVRQAEARVACCQRAVSYSEAAVEVAKQALVQSRSALTEVERSSEYVMASLRFVEKAQEAVNQELEAAEQMVQLSRAATQLVGEAGQHQRSAEDYSNSAQSILVSNRYQLDYRIRQLIQFNTPLAMQPSTAIGSEASDIAVTKAGQLNTDNSAETDNTIKQQDGSTSSSSGEDIPIKLVMTNDEYALDFSKLQYQIGSPHREVELYLRLISSEDRQSFQETLSNAETVVDTIIATTTMIAKWWSRPTTSKYEEMISRWLHWKYGPAPYLDSSPKTGSPKDRE